MIVKEQFTYMANPNKSRSRVDVINVLKAAFLVVLAILFIYRLSDLFDNLYGIKSFYKNSGDGWFFLLAPYIIIIMEMVAVFQKYIISIAMSIMSIMLGIVIFLYENMILFARLVNTGRLHDIGARPVSTLLLCIVAVVIIAFKMACVRMERNKKLNGR